MGVQDMVRFSALAAAAALLWALVTGGVHVTAQRRYGAFFA